MFPSLLGGGGGEDGGQGGEKRRRREQPQEQSQQQPQEDAVRKDDLGRLCCYVLDIEEYYTCTRRTDSTVGTVLTCDTHPAPNLQLIQTGVSGKGDRNRHPRLGCAHKHENTVCSKKQTYGCKQTVLVLDEQCQCVDWA